MKDKHRIIFIGEYRFPNGDAAAIRTLTLASMAKDLGYKVTVVGKGKVRGEDFDSSTGKYLINGVEYITMNPKKITIWKKILFFYQRINLFENELNKIELTNVKAIIVNASSSAHHIPLLIRFCKKKRIKLIADVCEWYDPCQINFGWFNPFYQLFLISFHLFFPRIKNMIVVSTLLEDHFKKKGCKVFRIPSPLDVNAIPYNFNIERSDKRLHIMYAGIPGHKDLVGNFIEGISLLTEDEKDRIEFRMLGPTIQQLKKLLKKKSYLIKELSNCIVAEGRVPIKKVINCLQRADFTILIRPNKRYANAGFPSKLPESLATGTPMILNITTDMKEFMEDGKEALIINGIDPQNIAVTIRRALSLSNEDILFMSNCARRRAEKSFDYRLFLEDLNSLIN